MDLVLLELGDPFFFVYYKKKCNYAREINSEQKGLEAAQMPLALKACNRGSGKVNTKVNRREKEIEKYLYHI